MVHGAPPPAAYPANPFSSHIFLALFSRNMIICDYCCQYTLDFHIESQYRPPWWSWVDRGGYDISDIKNSYLQENEFLMFGARLADGLRQGVDCDAWWLGM